MKTFEEIINQTPVYLHNWTGKVDLIGAFENIYMTDKEYLMEQEWFLEEKQKMDNAIKKFEDINILFASYGEDNWSGDAWVLFERNNKLYEVNGSHCSWDGLEGQWEPKEVVLKVLENRVINGTFGEDDWSGNEFKTELKMFLGIEV